MKINRILPGLLALAFLLGSCAQKEPFSGTFPVRQSASSVPGRVPSDPIPDDDPSPDPGPDTYPSLLSVLDDKIAEYNRDESIKTNHVYICAHRANTAYGKSHGIPENSLWAIATAIENGADFVELDVASTKDGVLMIMHDEALGTTTNGSGNIGDKTYGQVKELRMHPRGSSEYPKYEGDYVRVPTLQEALEACKGKIYVNLDMKDRAFPVSDILDAIDKSGTVNQVMIFGGTNDKKELINEAYNKLNHSKLAIHPYIGAPSDARKYLIKSYNGCAKLFQYNTDQYYNPGNYDESISPFGYKCHAYGVLSYSNSLDYDTQIASWTSGSCTVLDRFITSGTDVVQTDYCEKADQYLKTKGLR